MTVSNHPPYHPWRTRRGLITRNVRRSVQYFHDFLGLVPFKPAITRECEFPYK